MGRGAGLTVPDPAAGLVVLGGLPGVGKSTVARALARRGGAVHVRVDSIEQALVDAGLETHPVGPAGYGVAQAVARDQLLAGRAVVADAVNALEIAREGWRAAARAAGAPVLEVELVCDDRERHAERVTGRVVDVPGLVPPTWEEVAAAEPEPWHADLRLDTGRLSVDQAVDALVAAAGWLTHEGHARPTGPTGPALGGTSSGSW